MARPTKIHPIVDVVLRELAARSIKGELDRGQISAEMEWVHKRGGVAESTLWEHYNKIRYGAEPSTPSEDVWDLAPTPDVIGELADSELWERDRDSNIITNRHGPIPKGDWKRSARGKLILDAAGDPIPKRPKNLGGK